MRSQWATNENWGHPSMGSQIGLSNIWIKIEIISLMDFMGSHMGLKSGPGKTNGHKSLQQEFFTHLSGL